jgi:hypothetical protein
MTQPRPTAEELVDAVRAFLEDDLLPGLEGRQRFHARVAVNVLGIVGRELRVGAAAGEAERARLQDLLDADDAAVDELSRRLARSIRDGSMPIDDPALLAHLRLTSDADVSVANPRHAGG